MYLARTQDGMLMGEAPGYIFLKSNRNYVQRIHLCDMAGRDNVLNTILSKCVFYINTGALLNKCK